MAIGDGPRDSSVADLDGSMILFGVRSTGAS
jgi:hypothetical protein